MALLCLSGADVALVASKFAPDTLQTLMAHVFYTLSSNSTTSFTPHRITIPTPNHTALFMPARIAGRLQGTSVKIVCVPTSPADLRGLPASTLVLDEDTGAVKAILNASNLTALRNAAGSLLSLNVIGPQPEVLKNLVVFGAGAQIRAHLDLHLSAFPNISAVTIVNRSVNERAEKLATHVRSRFPSVQVECLAHDPTAPNPATQTAVSSAHLIICATSSTVPLFPSPWVRDGTHIVLIGSYTPSMHEVDADLIQRALLSTPSALLVDSRAACLAEAGELIDAGVGASQVVEIGELVSLDESGEPVFDRSTISTEEPRTGTAGRVTIFKSVGVGLQDVAIACAIVDEAQRMGVGSHVDWD